MRIASRNSALSRPAPVGSGFCCVSSFMNLSTAPLVSRGFPRPPLRVAIILPLMLLGVLLSGCALLQREGAESSSIFRSFYGSSGSSRTNAGAALQIEVMREADEYVAAVSQATDEFREQVNTREARNMALHWKLMEATAAYVNASGENPLLNAVDMVVLSTLARDVIETYWVGKRFGAPARPLLEVHQRLETNCWALASTILTPSQQEELRGLLKEYRDKNSDARYVGAGRLPELAATMGRAIPTSQSTKPGNIFSLLYLNPLAGLDPATVAIEQTRNLAQRAMYYAQRAPMLLGWQVELTTYQLADQPETQQLLTDVTDVADASQAFAKTAVDFPKLVNDQREAAINQLLAGVARESSNLVANLNAQESQLRTLLPEFRQTFTAGGNMAGSVENAVKSLDAFIRYVAPPDDPQKPATPSDSPPFNVLDYGVAAEKIGVTAQELNTLLTSLNQSLPQVSHVGAELQGNARSVVDHAFRRALVLVLLAGAIAFGVVWFHHRLRRADPGPR